VTWKQNGIHHDQKHDRIRLSKGANHKDGREFILCEYDAPPAATVETPDERGTSSRCSVCGHGDGDDRIERGLWSVVAVGRLPTATSMEPITSDKRR
jgi:hypothetical protein